MSRSPIRHKDEIKERVETYGEIVDLVFLSLFRILIIAAAIAAFWWFFNGGFERNIMDETPQMIALYLLCAAMLIPPLFLMSLGIASAVFEPLSLILCWWYRRDLEGELREYEEWARKRGMLSEE